jgi:hypothetical protein
MGALSEFSSATCHWPGQIVRPRPRLERWVAPSQSSSANCGESHQSATSSSASTTSTRTHTRPRPARAITTGTARPWAAATLEHWISRPAALLPPSSCCRPALLPVIAPTDRHTRALSHHVASFERCAAPLPCSTDPPHPNTPALTALPPRTRALHLSHTLASSSMGSACR